MAISTPIGYSLGRSQRVVGVSNLSGGRSLPPLNPNESGRLRNADGTAYGIFGVTSPYGSMSIGGTILSTLGDSVLTLQWQAPLENKRLGVSLGVQDAFSAGGSAGQDLDEDGDNSRSYFAVATYQVNPDLHVSIGKGDRRFGGVFGNVSHTFTDKWKAVVEYDTFNWNAMIAHDLVRFNSSLYPEQQEKVTVGIGIIRGKNVFWSISISF